MKTKKTQFTRREYIKYSTSFIAGVPLILNNMTYVNPVPLSQNIAYGEGLFAYRSFRPEFAAMKNFSNNNINTYCIFPSNTFNSLGEPYSQYSPIWRWFNQYDFESLNKQFDDVIAINSKAEFIAMIDLNSPIWLEKFFSHQYPGQGDSYEALSSTCANKKWKKEILTYINDIVQHLEKRYSNRIRAYLLSCGATSEWLDLGRGTSSKEKSELWKSWLREKKKKITDVPSITCISQASFENFIRNPQKEQNIIDYAQFTGDLIVNTVLEFAESFRRLISVNTKIGVFFGYILELASNRLVWAGHLEYERLFSSSLIDFFVSPGTYSDRLMGGGGGFMIPNGTRILNGKGYLHEIDHRTHTYNYKINDFITYNPIAPWKNQEESTAGLKREFSLSIINHAHLWCFDMFGGVFSTDETMEIVKQSKEIWDKYYNVPTQNIAEIALIVDPQSAKLVNDMNDEKAGEIYQKTRNKLNRIGAPFEVFSFNDLNKANLEQYKVVIFPGTFLITPERLSLLKKTILNNDRTVLFIYAPGISDGINLDVNRIKDITGVEFGKPGINRVEKDNWTSVYIYDYQKMTTLVLRQIAKDSGVHLFIEMETPVFANSNLLCIHVAQGGLKRISFPKKIKKVKELYSGKEIGVEGRSFLYKFSTPDTALFEYS